MEDKTIFAGTSSLRPRPVRGRYHRHAASMKASLLCTLINTYHPLHMELSETISLEVGYSSAYKFNCFISLFFAFSWIHCLIMTSQLHIITLNSCVRTLFSCIPTESWDLAQPIKSMYIVTLQPAWFRCLRNMTVLGDWLCSPGLHPLTKEAGSTTVQGRRFLREFDV